MNKQIITQDYLTWEHTCGTESNAGQHGDGLLAYYCPNCEEEFVVEDYKIIAIGGGPESESL